MGPRQRITLKTLAKLLALLLAGFFFLVGCQSFKAPPAGDHGAILYSETKPVYPRELLNAGLAGVVTVSYVVDASGRIKEVRVIASTHPLFAQAATEAIQHWRYWPAVTGGKPTRTLIQRTLRFDRIAFDGLR